ncbi:MAG: nuclear transport factor 2 family protein [Nocardioidaceae bacterium]
MTAEKLLRELAATIDSHRWGDLPGLLHEEFTCTLVHTGEVFDRDTWVSFNANYPGFQDFTIEESVGSGDHAAGRGHVTGYDAAGVLQHFGVATFITAHDGLIHSATEVWCDIDEEPPPGTR